MESKPHADRLAQLKEFAKSRKLSENEKLEIEMIEKHLADLKAKPVKVVSAKAKVSPKVK